MEDIEYKTYEAIAPIPSLKIKTGDKIVFSNDGIVNITNGGIELPPCLDFSNKDYFKLVSPWIPEYKEGQFVSVRYNGKDILNDGVIVSDEPNKLIVRWKNQREPNESFTINKLNKREYKKYEIIPISYYYFISSDGGIHMEKFGRDTKKDTVREFMGNMFYDYDHCKVAKEKLIKFMQKLDHGEKE